MTSTLYLGTTPSSPLGFKNYYRVVFDVAGELLWTAPVDKLNYIYDHLQDTGVIQPLSPNPATSGDTVMTVDCYTPMADSSTVTVAECVRRMEMIAGSGVYGTAVRSIQKLSGIGDVTGGASDRQDATESANQQNDKDSPLTKLENLFAGLGHYTTVVVIGVVAYAFILLVPSMAVRSKR